MGGEGRNLPKDISPPDYFGLPLVLHPTPIWSTAANGRAISAPPPDITGPVRESQFHPYDIYPKYALSTSGPIYHSLISNDLRSESSSGDMGGDRLFGRRKKGRINTGARGWRLDRPIRPGEHVAWRTPYRSHRLCRHAS